MELGVGHALVSLLDENGVPGIVQNTAIICPQSLMAPCQDSTRRAALSSDGMPKYDEAIDRDSAYEMLDRQAQEDEKQAQLDAEREALEKEKAAFEEQKRKEAEAAEKQKQKEKEAAEKKKEKEKEKKEAAAKKAAERRKAKIESQLISAGGQILKRGLLNTLFGKR